MSKTMAGRLQPVDQRSTTIETVTEPAPRRQRTRLARGLMDDLAGADMSPDVRSTVMKLMDELDRMSGELQEARQRVTELEEMADEDPLVPVLNRRGFLRELERTIAYSERYSSPSSIIFCDLDRFKLINDDYGHHVGDEALRQVAEILVDNVRRSDIVGRLGGDEFALVLQRATPEQAQIKAEELMQKVRARPLIHDGKEIGLAMSAGVAGFEAGDGVAELMERADKAMYRRKFLGPEED